MIGIVKEVHWTADEISIIINKMIRVLNLMLLSEAEDKEGDISKI